MPVQFNFDGGTLTAEGKRFLAEMQKLADSEIHVGFQRGDDPYDDGTDLVDVAAYNELGSSDRPARPVMKQSFENHEDELKAACGHAFKTVSNGGTAEAEIRDGEFEPNKESTIKKKGSYRPLIDTGHMRQSVNFVIKKGG